MVIGDLQQLKRALKPEIFVLINNFLEQIRPDTAVGNYKLKGDEVFAKVLEYNTSLDNNEMVEAHDKYVDIQFLLEGAEKINIYNRSSLKIREAYRSETDCIFFFPSNISLVGVIHMLPATFAVFFPDDAHLAALNPQGEAVFIKKIVFKVYEKYFT